MKNLSIDLDVLEDTYDYVNTAYNEFDELFNKLDKALEDLKGDFWESPAKNAFFSVYDLSWKGNIRMFMSILELMRDELSYIKKEYIALNEEKGFPKLYHE